MRKRKVNLRKLDSRSVKAKFLGYDDKSTAYILQEFSTKKIITARNVLFKEDEILSFSAMENSRPEDIDLDNERSNDQTTEKPVEDEVGDNREVIPNTHDELQDEEETSLRRTNRNRRPPERYGNSFTTQEETVTEPKTYIYAVSSTQDKYWKKAMQAEFESLENNHTWTLIQEPKDRKVLPGTWVYKVKYGAGAGCTKGG